MIRFVTERLLVLSDLKIEEGKLIENTIEKSALDLLNLKATTGKEGGFVFYDRNDTSTMICHIGITDKRNMFEITYGTEEKYRKNGYMNEALKALIDWIFTNTKENEIWAIPKDGISQYILEHNGFTFEKYSSENKNEKWFVVRKE